jgi:hypothetical protein
METLRSSAAFSSSTRAKAASRGGSRATSANEGKERGEHAKILGKRPRWVNKNLRGPACTKHLAPIRVIDTSVESAIFFWGVLAFCASPTPGI